MAVDFLALGQRIQRRRKALGKTQENLAENLQVSIGYISQIERGITKISLDTLSNVCEYLDCKPSEMLDGTVSGSTYMLEDLSSVMQPLSNRNRKLIYEMARLLGEFQN